MMAMVLVMFGGGLEKWGRKSVVDRASRRRLGTEYFGALFGDGNVQKIKRIFE